jgi:hypothetical protein
VLGDPALQSLGQLLVVEALAEVLEQELGRGTRTGSGRTHPEPEPITASFRPV